MQAVDPRFVHRLGGHQHRLLGKGRVGQMDPGEVGRHHEHDPVGAVGGPGERLPEPARREPPLGKAAVAERRPQSGKKRLPPGGEADRRSQGDSLPRGVEVGEARQDGIVVEGPIVKARPQQHAVEAKPRPLRSRDRRGGGHQGVGERRGHVAGMKPARVDDPHPGGVALAEQRVELLPEAVVDLHVAEVGSVGSAKVGNRFDRDPGGGERGERRGTHLRGDRRERLGQPPFPVAAALPVAGPRLGHQPGRVRRPGFVGLARRHRRGGREVEGGREEPGEQVVEAGRSRRRDGRHAGLAVAGAFGARAAAIAAPNTATISRASGSVALE